MNLIVINLKKFLIDTHKCIRDLQSKGIFFNIFSALEIQSNERKHSLFLANLLDPQGSHGQKDLFLKSFIKHIDILNEKLSDLSLNNSIVQTELYLGACDIDYLEGGSIDIAISNSRFTIFIENKIWAGDQKNQLYRYCNDKRKAIVLYLTPEGVNPDPISTCQNKVVKDKDYYCISYSEHILKWLEECIILVNSNERVSCTIKNYKYVIEEITKGGDMKEKIITEIIESEDTIESALLINEHIADAKLTLLNQLSDQLEKEALSLNKFDFEKDNWDYAEGSEAYLHFKYKKSKNNIAISFDFEWKTNSLVLYIGVSDLVNNAPDKIFKNEISKRLDSYVKDLKYDNWYFVSEVPEPLGKWDYNVDNWKGIINGNTAKTLIDIVKEFDNKIKDIVK